MRIKAKTLCMVLAIAGLVAVSFPSAAAQTRAVACQAAGANKITPLSNSPGSYEWIVEGSGSCVGGVKGILTMSFSGRGTSLGLGLCDSSPGPLGAGLFIEVTMTLLNHRTGVVTVNRENWLGSIAPGTNSFTYPVATSFQAKDTAGNLLGAGVMLDHIFGKCPPAGASSTQYIWTTKV